MIVACSLVHAYAFTTGMPANLVLGQTDFNSNTPLTSQINLKNPYGLVFDASGNLWVADTINSRVLMFKPPFSNGSAASLVIGQPDFNSGSGNGGDDFPSANRLSGPSSLAFDSSGNLWVADSGNNRVLRFSPPFGTNMGANLVIGQLDFTSRVPAGSAPTSTILWGPVGLAFDAIGNLWVADCFYSRVLKFSSPQSTHMAASLVIGQADFTHQGGGSISTNRVFGPTGLAFDAIGNLWVADNSNNRVLRFSSPLSTNMAASLVIGQPDFTHNDATASQAGLYQPYDLRFDAYGNLWVSDILNNRVLMFKSPSSNGLGASQVIGQPDFTYNYYSTSQWNLYQPRGLVFDASGNLWVADSSNNRVLRFAGSSGLTDFLLKLQVGWNLISLPITPSDNTMRTVLKGLIQLNDLIVVWSYQAGTWYYFVPPSSGTVLSMSTGYAYWVCVREPVNITVTGYVINPVTSTPPYRPLGVGWNMLGFTPRLTVKNMTVSQYLGSISGKYDPTRVLVYDNWNQRWVSAGPLTWLVPGQGMWIYMNATATLYLQ